MKPVKAPGQILKEVLRARGIQTIELTRRLGRNRSTINNIIRGHQTFPYWLAIELESLKIGTRKQWLLRMKEYEFYRRGLDWSDIISNGKEERSKAPNTRRVRGADQAT